MGAEKSNPFPPSVAVVPVSVVVVPDRHVGHLQQVSIDGDGGNYQVGGVDLEHFKSPPGIVKLFQLVSLFLKSAEIVVYRVRNIAYRI